MKICFLVDNIFTLGGVQRVVSVLANELSKQYTVDIISTNDEKINRDLYKLNDDINVILKNDLIKRNIIKKVFYRILRDLNSKTRFFNKKKYIKILSAIYIPIEVQKNLKDIINNNEYDIVIGVAGYSLVLGKMANELKCKVIGWQHSSYDAYLNTPYKYFWGQDQLFKEYIPKLDKNIVLTNYDKNLFKLNLEIDSKCIYNPLSFISQKKSNIKNKKVLYVGRLVEYQKGLDLLIDAFGIIVKKRADWSLTILGDGIDKEKIKNRIENLNLQNNIELCSFTDNVIPYYLNSSIFISSSRWEGFGLVITEAMECGLPVVAFENSGPNEIINNNGVNGILVENGNIDELSNSIIDLIDNYDKRKYISDNSIERAKDFQIDNIVESWNNTFKEILYR